MEITRGLLAGLVAISLVVSVEGASIEIMSETGLVFGAVIASPAGGSVTITPSSQRIVSGVYSWGIDSYGAARFTLQVEGYGNPHFTITLPSSVTLTNASGDALMVDTFESLPSGVGMTPPPQSSSTIEVGATLRIAPSQPGGAYSGVFPVLVNLGN